MFFFLDGDSSSLFTFLTASYPGVLTNDECKVRSPKWYPLTYQPVTISYGLDVDAIPASYGIYDKTCAYINGQAMHYSFLDTWLLKGISSTFEDREMEAYPSLGPRRVYCVQVMTTASTPDLWHRQCTTGLLMVCSSQAVQQFKIYLLIINI